MQPFFTKSVEFVLGTSKSPGDIPFATKPAEVINNQGDTLPPTGDYATRNVTHIFPFLDSMIWDDRNVDTPPQPTYQEYEYDDIIVEEKFENYFGYLARCRIFFVLQP